MVVGADHILFAADWPFEPNTAATHFLNQLPISELDREKIAHLNAERLLRLYAGCLGRRGLAGCGARR
jgi:predicted TIM-barrel fold metal-dependent hydrolase